MKKTFNLLVVALLTSFVCFGQDFQYQPWRPDMNMGPLTFNTLGDQQHPYVQCTYGSSYQNPTNPGILGSGNASSHAIITTDGPDPCRCYSINGQAYVHENYLPPFWDMDYTDHLDTAIRVG